MKIGILTDIHNNVIALDVILLEFVSQKCDKIICAGDIIGIGPDPEETVQKMMTIPDLLVVRGNHERYLLEGMPNIYPNDEKMSYEEMEFHRWEHQRLSQSSIAFLRKLPYQINFNVLGKNIAVMHYGMHQDHKFVNCIEDLDENDLWELFSQGEHDIIIYGHDHARMICQIQNKWFINAGSLGCPSLDQDVARAAILEITENDEIMINALDIKYNVDKVIEKIDRLKYPTYEEVKKIFFGVR